jgi:hypothetical protein
MSVTISAQRRIYLQLAVGGHMSQVRYLYLFVHRGVQHL